MAMRSIYIGQLVQPAAAPLVMHMGSYKRSVAIVQNLSIPCNFLDCCIILKISGVHSQAERRHCYRDKTTVIFSPANMLHRSIYKTL